MCQLKLLIRTDPEFFAQKKTDNPFTLSYPHIPILRFLIPGGSNPSRHTNNLFGNCPKGLRLDSKWTCRFSVSQKNCLKDQSQPDESIRK